MVENISDIVIEFINRRWSHSNQDYKWTDGNCYWFALILVTRFPYLQIYYDTVVGHFVAGDGIAFYDINGRYDSANLKAFNEIKSEDESHYKRLIRDCIL